MGLVTGRLVLLRTLATGRLTRWTTSGIGLEMLARTLATLSWIFFEIATLAYARDPCAILNFVRCARILFTMFAHQMEQKPSKFGQQKAATCRHKASVVGVCTRSCSVLLDLLSDFVACDHAQQLSCFSELPPMLINH